jgi:hypothetical protein
MHFEWMPVEHPPEYAERFPAVEVVVEEVLS